MVLWEGGGDRAIRGEACPFLLLLLCCLLTSCILVNSRSLSLLLFLLFSLCWLLWGISRCLWSDSNLVWFGLELIPVLLLAWVIWFCWLICCMLVLVCIRAIEPCCCPVPGSACCVLFDSLICGLICWPLIH
jgi:hypothetical protein